LPRFPRAKCDAMLAHYFGFEEDPFGATPDPRYLYSSRTHREALASLQYAFYSNRGFTALIAPPGMGKTTLLFEFLRDIRDKARTAFLFNSQMDPTDLLRNLLREIGATPRERLGQILEQLNDELLQTARSGRRFVLVVDEAQNLTEPSLETLRMLTNFETTRAKLMQIVLSGQPQLAGTLLNSGLLQLRQRISTVCRLEPFSRQDTIAYIECRLKVAGYKGSALFTPDALDRIAEASEGVPRNINTLCFNALSLCCALKQRRIDLPILSEAIADLQLAPVALASCEPASRKPELRLCSLGELEQRVKESRLTRMRVPGFALLLALCLVFVVWANRLQDQEQTQQRSTGALDAAHSLPSSDSKAAVPSPSEEPAHEAIEITVDPQQTLSDISVNKLGGFDGSVLREIENLNPGLTDPNLIHPGQKILLPKHSSPAREARVSSDLKSRK